MKKKWTHKKYKGEFFGKTFRIRSFSYKQCFVLFNKKTGVSKEYNSWQQAVEFGWKRK